VKATNLILQKHNLPVCAFEKVGVQACGQAMRHELQAISPF
jgi:hypothetical protein